MGNWTQIYMFSVYVPGDGEETRRMNCIRNGVEEMTDGTATGNDMYAAA